MGNPDPRRAFRVEIDLLVEPLPPEVELYPGHAVDELRQWVKAAVLLGDSSYRVLFTQRWTPAARKGSVVIAL